MIYGGFGVKASDVCCEFWLLVLFASCLWCFGLCGLLVWFILDCCGLRLVVGCGIVSRWRASVVVGVGCDREFLFGV